MRECTDWYVPLLFAGNKTRGSHDEAHLSFNHSFYYRRSLKEDSVCRIRRRSLAFPVTPEDFRQSSSASYPILKQGIPSIHVNHIEGDTQTFPEIYDISVWNHKDRGPNDINSLTSKFDDLAGSPLFSAWNIAETKKVCYKARRFYYLIYQPSYSNFPEKIKKKLFFFILSADSKYYLCR